MLILRRFVKQPEEQEIEHACIPILLKSDVVYYSSKDFMQRQHHSGRDLVYQTHVITLYTPYTPQVNEGRYDDCFPLASCSISLPLWLFPCLVLLVIIIAWIFWNRKKPLIGYKEQPWVHFLSEHRWLPCWSGKNLGVII